MKLATKKNRKKPAAKKTPVKRGRAAALRTKGDFRMRRQSYVLNDKEGKVLGAFGEPPKDKDEPTAFSLADLAKKAFNKRGVTPKTQGNSWVRNSLRKLVRLGLVKSSGAKSGMYTRTKLMPEEVLAKAERDGLIKSPDALDGDGSQPKKSRRAKAKADRVDKGDKEAKAAKAEKTEKTAGRKRTPKKAGATGRGKKAAKTDTEEGEPAMEIGGTTHMTVSEESPEGSPDFEGDDDDDLEGDDDGDELDDDAVADSDAAETVDDNAGESDDDLGEDDEEEEDDEENDGADDKVDPTC